MAETADCTTVLVHPKTVELKPSEGPSYAAHKLDDICTSRDVTAIRLLDIPPGLTRVQLVIGNIPTISWDRDELLPNQDLLRTKLVDRHVLPTSLATDCYKLLRFVYDTAALPKTGELHYETDYCWHEEHEFFLCDNCGMEHGRRLDQVVTTCLGNKAVAILPAVEIDATASQHVDTVRKKEDTVYVWERVVLHPDSGVPEMLARYRDNYSGRTLDGTPFDVAVEKARAERSSITVELQNAAWFCSGMCGPKYCFT